MPTLYVIATPIGNLEDLSARASRTLAVVRVIAAENTNTARRLLNHLGLHGKVLLSYNEHNRRGRIPQLLDHLAREDVGLISEAGTPGISDPGVELVRAARSAGHAVSPIPGPSAMAAALSVAGIATRGVTFLGFLPKGRQARLLLERFTGTPETLVIFEAPHRLHGTLALLLDTLGDREMFAGRELTKLYEEGWNGRLGEAAAHFAEARGEFTLVIAGAEPRLDPAGAVEERPGVDEALRLSTSSAEAVRRLAALGVSRRDAYQAWLGRRRKP